MDIATRVIDHPEARAAWERYREASISQQYAENVVYYGGVPSVGDNGMCAFGIMGVDECVIVIIEPDNIEVSTYEIERECVEAWREAADATHAVKCVGCGNLAAEEYDYQLSKRNAFDGRYINLHTDDGEPVCNWCEESDDEHASTVVIFGDGEKSAVRIGDYIGYATSGYAWDERDVVSTFGRPGWHATGGWGGYYEFAKPEGWTDVFAGWVTGDWGDSTSDAKLDSHRLAELMESHVDTCPFTVAFLLSPTSNVFSTACDVLVEGDEWEAYAFLLWVQEEAGLTKAQLDRAFS